MDPKSKELSPRDLAARRNYASMSVDLQFSDPAYIQVFLRDEMTWDDTPVISVHLTPEIIIRGSRSELFEFFLKAITAVASITEQPNQNTKEESDGSHVGD